MMKNMKSTNLDIIKIIRLLKKKKNPMTKLSLIIPLKKELSLIITVTGT